MENQEKVVFYLGQNFDSNENIYEIRFEAEIKEIEANTEQSINRTEDQIFDLFLYKGEIINSLPKKYLDMVKNGQSFEIEVIQKKYITYHNKNK